MSGVVGVALVATVAAWGTAPPNQPRPRTKTPLQDGTASLPVQPVAAGGPKAKKGKKDDPMFGIAHGAKGNEFVNDPCLDSPPPQPSRARTVQSETEIAVWNGKGSDGRLQVAGYNDSFGFSDNRQGLAGVAYSTDHGHKWIDQSGVPPKIPGGAPSGSPGQDATFGDPVVVVHNGTGHFFYSYIYMNEDGIFSLGVSRGEFMKAPQQVPVESKSSTRCAGDPAKFGTPDPQKAKTLRPIWDTPVMAVGIDDLFIGPDPGPDDDDFLDKEWLYVDQNTGTLYMTYTRFEPDGATPIEMVRCIECALLERPLTTADWTPPSVIVPNEALEFNQATQPYTSPTGRVIVTWFAREFEDVTFDEIEQRIEYAYSDADGASGTWTPEQLVTIVNPQGEPNGYNRQRAAILNAPYIMVDRGADDGEFTEKEMERETFGNVYITYFSGKTPLGSVTKAADTFISRSTDDGTTFAAPVKVNDDDAPTTHVFPVVQTNEKGEVYVMWIDRRNDPGANIMNETWNDLSLDGGMTWGDDELVSSIATSWYTRADARPNMGDYNSGDVVNFHKVVWTWADGRFPGTPTATCFGTTTFPCPTGSPPPTATPDTIFEYETAKKD